MTHPNIVHSLCHVILTLCFAFNCARGEDASPSDMRNVVKAQVLQHEDALKSILVSRIIEVTFTTGQQSEKPWRGMAKTGRASDVQISWVSAALAAELPSPEFVSQAVQRGDAGVLASTIVKTWPSKLLKARAKVVTEHKDNSLVAYYDAAINFIVSNSSMPTREGDVTFEVVVTESVKSLVDKNPWTYGEAIAVAIAAYRPGGIALDDNPESEAFLAKATLAPYEGPQANRKYALAASDLFTGGDVYTYAGKTYYIEMKMSREKVTELGQATVVDLLEKRFGPSRQAGDARTISLGGFGTTKDGRKPGVLLVSAADGGLVITLLDWVANNKAYAEVEAWKKSKADQDAKDAKGRATASGL